MNWMALLQGVALSLKVLLLWAKIGFQKSERRTKSTIWTKWLRKTRSPSLNSNHPESSLVRSHKANSHRWAATILESGSLRVVWRSRSAMSISQMAEWDKRRMCILSHRLPKSEELRSSHLKRRDNPENCKNNWKMAHQRTTGRWLAKLPDNSVLNQLRDTLMRNLVKAVAGSKTFRSLPEWVRNSVVKLDKPRLHKKQVIESSIGLRVRNLDILAVINLRAAKDRLLRLKSM